MTDIASSCLIKAEKLHVAYAQQQPVLNGLDLHIHTHELVGVIGVNGAGKSSLLRTLAGLLPVQNGKMEFDGKPYGYNRHHPRDIAYMEQESLCHWPLLVERVVALGRLPHQGFSQKLRPEDRRAIEAAMEDADIRHLLGRNVMSLSSGERARVMLARALAVEPRLLLADEPVAELDPAHQLGVMRLLHQKAVAGLGVVVVLHDLTLAARFCHRLLLLHEGKILADGSAKDVLTARNLHQALHVEAMQGFFENEAFIVPWREKYPPAS